MQYASDFFPFRAFQINLACLPDRYTAKLENPFNWNVVKVEIDADSMPAQFFNPVAHRDYDARLAMWSKVNRQGTAQIWDADYVDAHTQPGQEEKFLDLPDTGWEVNVYRMSGEYARALYAGLAPICLPDSSEIKFPERVVFFVVNPTPE